MRGEPGDAMARMKRWEAVRQRLAEADGNGRPVVDDVVEAVTEVVRHRDAVTVTVTVDTGGDLATVRIVQRHGRIEVTRLLPQPLATPPAPVAAARDLPQELPQELPDDGPEEWPRDMPWAGSPPIRPNWQSRDPETLDQTAARLAELIRQDPSLLDGNP
jgi:hypothetical protein